MFVRLAKNDCESQFGETVNVLNRRSRLPIIDVHCHVFGQSLTEPMELHKWSDPTRVTFVKAGTDGGIRKYFDPSVLITKPIDADLKKFGSAMEDGAAMADEARKSQLGQAAEGEASKLGGKAFSALKKEADKKMSGMPDELKEAKKAMPSFSKEEMEQAAQTAAALGGAAAVSAVMKKINARGVVEVPAEEWPPKASSKMIGDRVFFIVELTDKATIHCQGIGSPGTPPGEIRWLIGQIEHKMARFIKYFTGDDGANAAAVLKGVPRMGGRAVVPLLLDLGYTPLDVPIPLVGSLIGWLLGLPDAAADPDGYYPDNEYIWFDRTKFEETYKTLSRVAVEHPYEIFPFIPFDPRRPDAITHVKKAVDELGFVGVKLYSRCGWCPGENKPVHGTEIGMKLDPKLDELFSYCEEKDLPLVNHTSPTGFPPNAVLAFPKRYSAGTMFHNRMLHPGRIGIGPLPVGVESVLKKLQQNALEVTGLPSPGDLVKQAKETKSKMLGKVGELAGKTKDISEDDYSQLLMSVEKARGIGERDLERLTELASPAKLGDAAARRQLSKYIDPAHLDKLSGKFNPSDFYGVASSVKQQDFGQISDLMNPAKQGGAGSPKDVIENVKGVDAQEAKRRGLRILFEVVCNILARVSCYKAARYCHYVQFTTSPYAWDAVLEKHPKLRLNFAHCGGELGMAAHLGFDLLHERNERYKAAEDKSTVKDDELTEEEKKKLKTAANLIPGVHENAMVASGERFKESLFAECAKAHAVTAMFAHIGTGEDAANPAKPAVDMVTKLLEKVLPAIFAKVLKEYSLKDIHKGVMAEVPEILKEELWQHWLEDWAEAFPLSWVGKIKEHMEKYENVYADIAYLTGDSAEMFKELLGPLAHEACPDTSQRTGSEVGVVDTSTDGSSSETIWADRIMIGTDWFMTEMHDITASGFWSWVDDVVNTDHPLWERWASRNAVDYLNLKDRIENLEKLYEDNSVPAKKRPAWWGALKAYYAKTEN